MFQASKLLAKHHITGIFSERHGGLSPAPFNSLNLGFGLGDATENIRHNLKILCATAHIPMPHRSQQVHRTSLLLCDDQGIQHDTPADILITCTAGCSVAVRTADCLPILLVDPKAGVAAAVHAGWRGTVQQVAQVAIQHMQKLGAHTEHILASLGPCISTCCFEVDIHTAELLASSHPQAQAHIYNKKHKAWPDLQAINTLQLQSSGIQTTNIESMRLCTCCLTERFFSHRRDSMQSGRQLAIVALPASL